MEDMDFYLERIRERLSAVTRGMTTEDLSRHPEGKWSSAEVLEHLSLTYEGTARGFQKCLDAGAPIARRPSLRDRIVVTLVITVGFLPGGRQAPEGTRPMGRRPAEALPTLLQNLATMDGLITRCEERFGNGRLMDHPILGPLSAAEWRKFHWVHARHHVKQIQRLRRA